MKRKTTGFVAAAVALAAGINAAELPPLMMIRLRAPHTADDAQWAKTRTVLVANRGACDGMVLDGHRVDVARTLRMQSALLNWRAASCRASSTGDQY